MPTTPPNPALLAFVSAQPASMADADVAAAANVATYTPRVDRIDWTSIGNTLGVAAVGVSGAVDAMKASSTSATAAEGAYVDKVLSGSGFDATSTTALALVQQFVAAGVLTADQANVVLNTVSYAAGGTGEYAAADVTTARAWNARQVAVAAYQQAATTAYATLVNGTLVAAIDPTAPMPTAASYEQAVAAAMAAAGVA